MRFSKVLGVLLICLLWTARAFASYTSAQLVAGPDFQSDGLVHYIAVFSGQGESDVKQDVVVSGGQDITTGLQAALRAIAEKLNHTKSKDSAVPVVGAVVDVRPAGSVEPSADDLALVDFQKLVVAWRALQIRVAQGEAGDVAGAWAAVVSQYGKASVALAARYDQVLVIVGKGV